MAGPAVGIRPSIAPLADRGHRSMPAHNAQIAGASAAPKSAATPDQAQRLGTQFEHMFLSQMLAPMFEGLDTEGTFGGGTGERMFRSFQIDSYAQAITRRGGVGIAQRVAREILSLQEKQNG